MNGVILRTALAVTHHSAGVPRNELRPPQRSGPRAATRKPLRPLAASPLRRRGGNQCRRYGGTCPSGTSNAADVDTGARRARLSVSCIDGGSSGAVSSTFVWARSRRHSGRR